MSINAAPFTLVNTAVTTAQNAAAQTAIEDLEGMSSVTLVAKFGYGSGGTSCSAVVQMTPDEGTTWLDIARFDFLVAAATKWCVLEGSSAKAVASYTALASEGVNNGLLSNRLRVSITSVGTYVNTTLAVYAAVR